MQFGSYNYYKIKFFLDVLQTPAERLAYLKKLRKDVERIIDCFSSHKAVPLRMYADERVNLPDGCPELTQFLQNAIQSQSPFPNDKRMPSNEILKELVKKETLQYEKLLMVIDSEVDHIIKTGEPVGREINKEVKSKVEKEDLPIENKQVYQELNPDKITKLLIEIDKQTEELNNVREELNISEDMLKFVVELLIKEGFIKNDKLNSTSNFVKKYSTPQKQKHKNVSNG
ncbi:MAG: hypothetical protein CMF23_00150 [Ignavibacteriae bacterium]|nr:hypothetical protein [Ignavibacteriota bacterium]